MIRYFVGHPVASNLIMAGFALLGIAVIFGIERETFPEFAATNVSVSVRYTGASATDVDEEVCQPLEDALNGITGMKDLECLSVDGLATATAEMQESADLGQFYNDISSAASSISGLPTDADTPSVTILGQTELIAMLAVSNVGEPVELLAYAEALADDLQSLPEIATASVKGISAQILSVRFDATALHRFGLSADEVISIIEARSLRQPIGEAQTSGETYLLRYSDSRRDVPSLERLIILDSDSGGIVRLSDMATVAFAPEDPDMVSLIDGQPTAIVVINKGKDTDSIDAFDAAQVVIDARVAHQPDGPQIDVINNLTEAVSERITLVTQNIMTGLALVLITMWLFFKLGESFWISMTLPVSFLGTFFIMSVMGLTINMISLIALLMSVGLIMDDSIVIAENIARWRRKVGPLEAAARGAADVMPGIISSFLTTACVFGPLMFMTGTFGAILRVIPIVLLITLTVSLVEAFLILPRHLYHHGDKQAPTKDRPVARVVENFKTRRLLPFVALLVHWRYLTLGVTVGILIFCVGLLTTGTVKVIGFPSSESDTVIARVALTSGLPRSRTEAVVDQILLALDTVDAKRSTGTVDQAPLVQRILVEYGTNTDTKDNGPHTATITVDLLESSLRNVWADDILADWRIATGPIPDIVLSNFSQSEATPGGSDLDVTLAARDLDDLRGASAELLATLTARADVLEAFSDFGAGRSELRLAISEHAYSLGLTPQTLVNQLRNAFSGAEVDSFRLGVLDISVDVALDENIGNLQVFENFPVVLPSGEQAPLSAVAEIRQLHSDPQITRKNGFAVARIQGKIDNNATTATAISAVVTDGIGPMLIQSYPGLKISTGGSADELAGTMGSTLVLLGLGLIGVFGVLSFQFRSYSLPIVVMLSIPFALIGSLLGHWGMGLAFSMPSMIGFASLAGIVVNNAILFLTFFQGHLEGGDYVKASVKAVEDRFRPVLLSSSTTFMGLLPLVFNTSPQVQSMVPLAVSVAFGLLASAVLVVLVLPAAMCIYFDWFSIDKWHAAFDDDEPVSSN